ncbi:MAG: hypothetical protein JSV65_00775 [Armatimonadota bacterium]|nr:MAG: hypothetical protein JSV65_00775 [Armatimonadota bacterium]
MHEPAVTRRAIAVGLVGTAALGVITPWTELYLRGTWIAACHLPIGAFVLFALWAGGVNALLHRLSPRWCMTRREVLVSYLIMLVAAGIPSFGLTEYLLPTLAGAFYFETPENGWQSLFFRHIPQWFVPVDLRGYPAVAGTMSDNWVYGVYAWLPKWLHPAGPEIIRQFYEAIPDAQRMGPVGLLRTIPWGAWLIPMAAWTAMAYTLFFILLCITVVLRRQWVERERLAFPLVQIPLDITRSEPVTAALPSFFRSRVMWAGFAIPFIVHSMNGLHVYLPAVPDLPVAHDLAHYFRSWPWNQTGMLGIWTHFSVIGFSFLIPTDLSFSLWFFYFVYQLETIGVVALGYALDYVPTYSTPTFAAYQMLGAFFMLGGGMAWAARAHLRTVWDRTVAAVRQQGPAEPDREAPDADEALPYHVAVLGLGAGALLLAAILSTAGLDFGIALLSIVLFLITAIVLTRFVAEGGLLFIAAPFRPSDIMIAAVGTRPLGAHNLTVLAYVERALALFDVRSFIMPSFMDAWRMCDAAQVPKRRLLPALAAGVVIATVVSYAALIILAYRYGGVTLEQWFLISSPREPFVVLASYLTDPRKASLADIELTGVGAVATWALMALRARFVGWPLHPIGYAMGPSWPMIQLWFSILVGWWFKWLILRWGGMSLFRRARPFFLGLVLGEFATAALWIVIDSISGVRGHRFFLF